MRLSRVQYHSFFALWFLELGLFLFWRWSPPGSRSSGPKASDPLDGPRADGLPAERIQSFPDDTRKSHTVCGRSIDLKSTRIKLNRKVRSYSYIEIYSNQLPPLLIDGANKCVIFDSPFCSTVFYFFYSRTWDKEKTERNREFEPGKVVISFFLRPNSQLEIYFAYFFS